jgi:copper transport protein
VRSLRGAVLVALLLALALPASAAAHAGLVRTDPAANAVVDGSPAQVSLTYTEPVEPRFAIVSVTDPSGAQMTAGPPTRPGGTTLVVPLKTLQPGWYLVFWRVVSQDGHPVRGAYTFAVGPNPGPAPQFVIPSTSETAATPTLVIARAVVLLSLLVLIGLLAFRLVIARPVRRRVPEASLRPVTVAAMVALAVALVATPIYVELATAQFALRSATAIGDVVPLIRDSSFGRGFTDLWLILALLGSAGVIAIRIDRPDREQRSVAEVGALTGVVLAAGAALVVPGLAGHPVTTSPVGIALATDALHLLAGSLWLGGLAGLLLLAVTVPAGSRVEALTAVVPRFSNVAFTSVLVLIASGTVATYLHLPTLASLWETSYGKAILAKVILLLLALPLAAVNLVRARPRIETEAAPAGVRQGGVHLLTRLVGGEALILTAIVAVAAILTSLPPPAKALGALGKVAATLGPGEVHGQALAAGDYRVALDVAPNRAAVPNTYRVAITKGGKPVTAADVKIRFTMLDMEMGQQVYQLTETGPGSGVYQHAAPAFVMVGHWGVDVDVTPRGGQPFDVTVLDRPGG